jgi:hypothetical protein
MEYRLEFNLGVSQNVTPLNYIKNFPLKILKWAKNREGVTNRNTPILAAADQFNATLKFPHKFPLKTPLKRILNNKTRQTKTKTKNSKKP